MMSPDLQRIKYIRDYCIEVEKTIARYGKSFDIFDHDPDYQRSVSFCILQIGELSGGLSQEYRQSTANHVQSEYPYGMLRFSFPKSYNSTPIKGKSLRNLSFYFF